MLLDDWRHVAKLFNHYDPIQCIEPQIELFEHNRVTYEQINKLRKECNQVAVVQATGTGKSFLIAKVLIDYLPQRKIVLAPSNYILDQQRSKVPWLSDSTDYMTYSKLARMGAEEIGSLHFDLIILDEFHRCGADVWGRGVQTLLDSNIRAKILGTTATPVRYLDNRRDMAEELFDGVLAANLSLAEAIVRRILPSPIYISALYTLDEEIENLLIDIEESRCSDLEKNEYREEIKQIKIDWEKTSGVSAILKRHLSPDINKLIVFCRDQQHLDEMEIEVQRWFLKAGRHARRKTYRVLSDDPDSSQNLGSFKRADKRDTVHLLFAIDMLNEGLHIPEVGAVILLRPTESPIIFYQQIGRCIEVGKDHAPIIFDLVNNFRNLRANDFLADLEEARVAELQRRKELGLPELLTSINIRELARPIEEIFEVIRDRLRPWESMFLELCKYKDEYGDCNVPNKYLENPSLRTWVNIQRVRYKFKRITPEQINKLNQINFIWDPINRFWEIMFDKLSSYKRIYGHCNVQSTFKDSNPHSLASWVRTQRQRYKNSSLSKDKIKRLELIGFCWIPREKNWDMMLDELCHFKATYGHCNVSLDDPKNSVLGRWVHKQRTRKSTLSNERILRLENIGFEWNPVETSWEKLFDALCSYRKKYGHCNVPDKFPQNPALGFWVVRLRTLHRRGRMSAKRLERLNNLGFDWDPSYTVWQRMYASLCDYKAKNGNCLVPAHKSENPCLGTWVGTQRLAKKKGRLNPEQIQQLNEVGFVWEPYEALWAEKFNELCEYLKNHVDCNVPDKYSENPSLGNWVSKQRVSKKKGKLPDEKVQQLERIGFDWVVHAVSWERMFNELIKFKKSNGHANVPQHYSQSPMLARWVNTQRTKWKKGQLIPEMIKKLEGIDFEWAPKTSSAESMLFALSEFKDKYGHCLVPRHYPENPGLAVWVRTRRALMTKGRLPLDHIQRLNVIGFEWHPHDDAWERNYTELCSYKEAEGHCKVPQSHPVLGRWVSKQRQKRKKGLLPKGKIKRLDDIGFVWEPKAGKT